MPWYQWYLVGGGVAGVAHPNIILADPPKGALLPPEGLLPGPSGGGTPLGGSTLVGRRAPWVGLPRGGHPAPSERKIRHRGRTPYKWGGLLDPLTTSLYIIMF